MNAVVVIGANGQLGTDLCRSFTSTTSNLLPLTRADLELRDHTRVAATLEAIHPAVIVNTAAFHKVEACETDVEQAFDVNCIAVRNLAEVANRLGALLVHLSTDYVFDGTSQKAYAETSAPNPINAYGISKAAGESFVRSVCRRHLIVRTSGLYGVAGSSGKGGNFVETMLQLGRDRGQVPVVADQVLSPTYTFDLAQTIWQLVDADAEGLYHVTNSESCSWYEFARAIFDFSSMPVDVRPIDTAASGTTVRRPSRSVLANERLNSAGFGQLRPWRQALTSYLAARATTQGPALTPAGAQGAENQAND